VTYFTVQIFKKKTTYKYSLCSYTFKLDKNTSIKIDEAKRKCAVMRLPDGYINSIADTRPLNTKRHGILQYNIISVYYV